MQGPGTILRPTAGQAPPVGSIQYIYTTRAPFHQVVWTGEPGLEGNFVTQFQWGWITNTGPADYLTFPEADITQMEAVTAPSGSVAGISQIKIKSGETGEFKTDRTINRTLDTVYIYGTRTDTVTEIQILDAAGNIVQKINPRSYIMSDQMIKLPPGVLGSTSEGPVTRLISLSNSKGVSASSDFAIITTGVPLILSTQYDGLPLNTRKSLLIRGSGFISAAGLVNRIEFYDDNNVTNYELDPPNYQMVTAWDDNVSGRKWTVTDTTIYIPADYFYENNATAFGPTIGLANTRIRSDGNNTDVSVNTFGRNIRVTRSDGARSPARPNVHHFTHIGNGGDRAVVGQTWPVIKEVFTTATIPALFSTDDANRTWVRGDDADILTIRGTGLDLALSIYFIDGEGNLIQSTDNNGLPPRALSLRNTVETSVLAAGVSLQAWPGGGLEGFELTIRPTSFGINGNALFDSQAGTNLDPRRRVVIRTPFGTAIAPPGSYLFIQN
jgi:hypothetical protein